MDRRRYERHDVDTVPAEEPMSPCSAADYTSCTLWNRFQDDSRVPARNYNVGVRGGEVPEARHMEAVRVVEWQEK